MLRFVLLAVALALAGCQRPSHDSASAAGSRPAPQANIADASVAIASCRQKLDDGDFLAANDYLLAAMRVAPTSPDVFAVAMDFVQSAAKADQDSVVDLANDVYVRADGLIPFQPIDNIEKARRQYTQVAATFSRPQQVVEPQFHDGLDLELAILTNDQLPHDVASLVIDRAHARLDAMAFDIAHESLESDEVTWDRWIEAKKQLDDAEFRWLAVIYAERRRRVTAWTERIAQLKNEYQVAQPSGLFAVSDEIINLTDEGNRLRVEYTPFVAAGITAAKDDLAVLNRTINMLERVRERIYNQHALATLTSFDTSSEPPTVKLRRIAEYDTRRLAAYVLQRFEDRWSSWFDELDSDEEKVEATKARVMLGAKL